ncbi:MAG TPA: hypothetical protein VKP30_25500 [Polyangiaceae bacterium]|nr:hypothetical protein [Polyangiaceae bacterium]
MAPKKQPKAELVGTRSALSRPSVLLGRERRVAERSTQMVAAMQLAKCRTFTEQTPASDDLQRYRRGEITEAEYLQGRIEIAISHLKGRLSAGRLQMLRNVITTRLDTDPLLLEARARLLKTGSRPTETVQQKHRK